MLYDHDYISTTTEGVKHLLLSSTHSVNTLSLKKQNEYNSPPPKAKQKGEKTHRMVCSMVSSSELRCRSSLSVKLNVEIQPSLTSKIHIVLPPKLAGKNQRFQSVFKNHLLFCQCHSIVTYLLQVNLKAMTPQVLRCKSKRPIVQNVHKQQHCCHRAAIRRTVSIKLGKIGPRSASRPTSPPAAAASASRSSVLDQMKLCRSRAHAQRRLDKRENRTEVRSCVTGRNGLSRRPLDDTAACKGDKRPAESGA